METILEQSLIWLVPGIPAITLHECAHGWMALRFGDPTARDAKRLSLNPLRHIDLMGTLIIPGLMLLTHMPFLFGWAKPVPVDFSRLRHGRMGIIFVALAGPLANLVMMFAWLTLAAFLKDDTTNSLFGQMALSGAALNLVLMIFNLIPIPPLDGSRIVGALLPSALAEPYRRLERYGILILLLLIVTGAFDQLLNLLVTKLLPS